jgi:recombinational DNA repair ATPase RecF
LLKNYEKIVKNRNKVLKNIFEGKSKKEEIDFWNRNFIQTAKKIYEYKIPLNNFIQQQIQLHPDIFQNKITSIDYTYITKVNLENIEESIQTYLDKNFERDIIL